MRGVLQQIVDHKKLEVAERQALTPESVLRKKIDLTNKSRSMKEAILRGSGVIAEFKRASPSKGMIRENANPQEIAQAYQQAGASAVSVLTDNHFFRGTEDDLRLVRSSVELPILRKDFTIHPYQLVEAKAIGADCILLIAAILTKEQLYDLHAKAVDLGLEVLVEIHDEIELEKLSGREALVGINNRNLDTFEVDIANSIRLAGLLPDAVRIAESGLGNDSNIKDLVAAGFHGFLIGESFMKEEDPGKACRDFIKQIPGK